MAQDKWFRIVDDRLEDIPSRINQLKSGYTLRIILFLFLISLGGLMMWWGDTPNMVALGVFVAVTGIAGIMAVSVMAHTQLCLYRTISEMRQSDDRR